jgi:hypothetical protein
LTALWPWLALTGLGLFHGINPAMGWLFAVALGLQAGEASAVLRALPPIALGHAASIALVVIVIAALRASLDPTLLQLAAAACLLAFGLYRLALGYRHKFRVGMVVGFRDLLLWSFLMATAHGAGLMVAPVLLAVPTEHHAHAAMADIGGSLWLGLLAVAVHTGAMLAAAGAVAWIVFRWVGLAVLRRGWINLDLLWSAALIGIGAVFALYSGAELALGGGAHLGHG